jgi:hypothetical protein
VVAGVEVVAALGTVDTGQNDRPAEPVVLESVAIDD